VLARRLKRPRGMLARLLFAAVALPLIGALPDAHASRAAVARDDAGLAPATAARAAATCLPPAAPIAASASASRGR
jgi:hypothetical protein